MYILKKEGKCVSRRTSNFKIDRVTPLAGKDFMPGISTKHGEYESDPSVLPVSSYIYISTTLSHPAILRRLRLLCHPAFILHHKRTHYYFPSYSGIRLQ